MPTSPAPQTRLMIDQTSLRSRPLVPSKFVGFLPAMVEAGRALHGDAWEDAETKATVLTTGLRNPQDPHAGKVQKAFDWLSTAIVDTAIPVSSWRFGMTGEPQWVQPGIISTDTINLIRHGHIWRDRQAWHIFVERTALSDAIVAMGKATQVSLEGLHLSYDLQLAVAVIREWNLTPDNTSTVDAITEKILELAKRNERPVSPRRAKEIARLVRPG